MLCYGPLVSEFGGQSARCPQPRHWGPVPPPPGSAAYGSNINSLGNNVVSPEEEMKATVVRICRKERFKSGMHK